MALLKVCNRVFGIVRLGKDDLPEDIKTKKKKNLLNRY